MKMFPTKEEDPPRDAGGLRVGRVSTSALLRNDEMLHGTILTHRLGHRNPVPPSGLAILAVIMQSITDPQPTTHGDHAIQHELADRQMHLWMTGQQPPVREMLTQRTDLFSSGT